MMKYLLPFVLAGLVGCGTVGDQDYQAYLDGGHVFYVGFCVSQPDSGYCTKDAKAKAEDAYKAASKAVAAYNNGDIDYDKMMKAVKAAFKLFADFQG